MCYILYVFVLCSFIRCHECFYLGEPSFAPDATIDRIMKNYLLPFRRLTNLLPNHNIELQLDVVGPSVPNTNTNYKKYKNVAPMKKLPKLQKPSIVSRFSEDQLNRLPPSPQTPSSSPSPPPQHSTTKAIARQKEDIFSEANNQPPVEKPHISDNALHSMFHHENKKEEEENDKKPIFMEDLKKVMEDFGKRYLAGGVEPGEDDKKPLLKKDLWMALGVKHLKENIPGCSSNNNNQLQQSSNNNNNSNTNNNVGRSMNRVLQILQKNLQGIKINQNHPPPSNLQWIQVKIPNNLMNNRNT